MDESLLLGDCGLSRGDTRRGGELKVNVSPVRGVTLDTMTGATDTGT